MKTFTKAFTIAAVLVAFAAVPAYPQQEEKAPLTRRSDAQKKDDAEIDKAYRAATKGEVTPSVKSDPWRSVRPADADKAKR
jgi:hypothetical protein